MTHHTTHGAHCQCHSCAPNANANATRFRRAVAEANTRDVARYGQPLISGDLSNLRADPWSTQPTTRRRYA